MKIVGQIIFIVHAQMETPSHSGCKAWLVCSSVQLFHLDSNVLP